MSTYNSELIRSLNSRIYWSATKDVYDAVFEGLQSDRDEAASARIILNHLTQIMRDSSEGVGEIQDRRYEKGEISDKSQSTVSIAGNNFQALVGYALEINRLVGNIPNDLSIVVKPRSHELIESYASIEVAEGETQKPDIDLLIYSEDSGSPISIFSCKTSLRERAGQTYRWKLLMDMATCDCTHEESCALHAYELDYESRREILISLVTADFYNERGNEQQQGMFVFFDNVFVTRDIDDLGNVTKMENIVDLLNEIY